jgi:hypothetical protein
MIEVRLVEKSTISTEDKAIANEVSKKTSVIVTATPSTNKFIFTGGIITRVSEKMAFVPDRILAVHRKMLWKSVKIAMYPIHSHFIIQPDLLRGIRIDFR